jgi:transcriptional regulator with XRE-family HTH domain
MYAARIKRRTNPELAQAATRLLGRQIRLGRKSMRMSEKALCEFIGLSRGTLRRIEAGDTACGIGTVLEAAAAVHVYPFGHRVEEIEARNRDLNGDFAVIALERRRRGRRYEPDWED